MNLCVVFVSQIVPIPWLDRMRSCVRKLEIEFSLITLCLVGEKWPGEALPVWDGQAEVTKEGNGEGGKSRRRIDLQDFFIPAREWVSLGELLSSIVSQAPLDQTPESVNVCVILLNLCSR